MYHIVAPLLWFLVAKLRRWRGKLTGEKPTFLSLFDVMSMTAQKVDARPNDSDASSTSNSNTTTSSVSPSGTDRPNCSTRRTT